MKLTSAAMGSLQAASATGGLAGSANQQLLAARAGAAGNQTASPSKNAAISSKRSGAGGSGFYIKPGVFGTCLGRSGKG